MKPLIVVASCVALVGCAAPIKWYRADATEQQLIQDRAYCAFEAEKSTASYGPGPRAYSVADAIAQGIGQGLEIAARQQSIFKLCMQARGYVPIQGSAPGTGYVERPAGEGVIVHSARRSAHIAVLAVHWRRILAHEPQDRSGAACAAEGRQVHL
jgi:hypothetical protein